MYIITHLSLGFLYDKVGPTQVTTFIVAWEDSLTFSVVNILITHICIYGCT
jgi:hypothetical protein